MSTYSGPGEDTYGDQHVELEQPEDPGAADGAAGGDATTVAAAAAVPTGQGPTVDADHEGEAADLSSDQEDPALQVDGSTVQLLQQILRNCFADVKRKLCHMTSTVTPSKVQHALQQKLQQVQSFLRSAATGRQAQAAAAAVEAAEVAVRAHLPVEGLFIMRDFSGKVSFTRTAGFTSGRIGDATKVLVSLLELEAEERKLAAKVAYDEEQVQQRQQQQQQRRGQRQPAIQQSGAACLAMPPPGQGCGMEQAAEPQPEESNAPAPIKVMRKRCREHFSAQVFPKVIQETRQQGISLEDAFCQLQGTGAERACGNARTAHVHQPQLLLEAADWPKDVPFIHVGSGQLRKEEYLAYIDHFDLDKTGLEPRRPGRPRKQARTFQEMDVAATSLADLLAAVLPSGDAREPPRGGAVQDAVGAGGAAQHSEHAERDEEEPEVWLHEPGPHALILANPDTAAIKDAVEATGLRWKPLALTHKRVQYQVEAAPLWAALVAAGGLGKVDTVGSTRGWEQVAVAAGLQLPERAHDRAHVASRLRQLFVKQLAPVFGWQPAAVQPANGMPPEVPASAMGTGVGVLPDAVAVALVPPATAVATAGPVVVTRAGRVQATVPPGIAPVPIRTTGARVLADDGVRGTGSVRLPAAAAPAVGGPGAARGGGGTSSAVNLPSTTAGTSQIERTRRAAALRAPSAWGGQQHQPPASTSAERVQRSQTEQQKQRRRQPRWQQGSPAFECGDLLEVGAQEQQQHQQQLQYAHPGPGGPMFTYGDSECEAEEAEDDYHMFRQQQLQAQRHRVEGLAAVLAQDVDPVIVQQLSAATSAPPQVPLPEPPSFLGASRATTATRSGLLGALWPFRNSS